MVLGRLFPGELSRSEYEVGRNGTLEVPYQSIEGVPMPLRWLLGRNCESICQEVNVRLRGVGDIFEVPK